MIALDTLRGQIGILPEEYNRMCDFKRRVLDLAVKEINEKTDLSVAYTQNKKGKPLLVFSLWLN